jgi:hypothetical protein
METLSSGNTMTVVRWVTKSTASTIASAELRCVLQAREVALSLSSDRPDLVLSAHQVLKWVYFGFSASSLQELAQAQSAVNIETRYCTVDEGGRFTMATQAKNTKRCELDSVGKIEDCFTALRFLWLKFYNNAFVYAFFAKVTAHIHGPHQERVRKDKLRAHPDVCGPLRQADEA